MPHTKEKKMINTNRAVVVNFEGNCHGVTPMCPPGGTYSIAGTLTSATDLASSRSEAVCGHARSKDLSTYKRPETCDKTQRPETYLTPVTTNQVRGTITLGGTISACGPASLPVCGPLNTEQLGTHYGVVRTYQPDHHP